MKPFFENVMAILCFVPVNPTLEIVGVEQAIQFSTHTNVLNNRLCFITV